MYPGYALPSTQARPMRRSVWLPLVAVAGVAILTLAGLTIVHLLAQLDTMTSTLTHVSAELQTLRTMNRRLATLDQMSLTLKAMDGRLSQTNRQLAVKMMAPKCELLLVVGSQNSSNAHRLVETSRAVGTPSYLIDGPEDIQPEWLTGIDVVGVTGSASTSEAAVSELIAALQPKTVEEFRAVDEDVFFNLPAELRA